MRQQHLSIFDIETVARPDAAEFLDPVEPPANYKDPEKIAAYLAEAQRKRLEKAALDPDLCQIIAIGVAGYTRSLIDREGNTLLVLAHGTETMQEAELLYWFWELWRSRLMARTGLDDRPMWCGFNCLAFDLPVLIRRSQMLGVQHPSIEVSRWTTDVHDLMHLLTFKGTLPPKSLRTYCKLFGQDWQDPTTGADIHRLYQTGDWAAILQHVRHDVTQTMALAERVLSIRS